MIDAAGKHGRVDRDHDLGGLRASELTALRWRDIDLPNGRLYVADAKTDAGRRTVDLSPDLRDELLAHKTYHEGERLSAPLRCRHASLLRVLRDDRGRQGRSP